MALPCYISSLLSLRQQVALVNWKAQRAELCQRLRGHFNTAIVFCVFLSQACSLCGRVKLQRGYQRFSDHLTSQRKGLAPFEIPYANPPPKSISLHNNWLWLWPMFNSIFLKRNILKNLLILCQIVQLGLSRCDNIVCNMIADLIAVHSC